MCAFVIGAVYVTSWTAAAFACLGGFVLQVVFQHDHSIPICTPFFRSYV